MEGNLVPQISRNRHNCYFCGTTPIKYIGMMEAGTLIYMCNKCALTRSNILLPFAENKNEFVGFAWYDE